MADTARPLGDELREANERLVISALAAREAAEREMVLREQLEAQRRSLETLVEHAPVGIAVLRGADLVYELANPAFQAFAPGKEVVGRAFAEVWPELAQDFVPVLRGVLATGVPFRAVDLTRQISRAPEMPLETRCFTITAVAVADHEGRRDAIMVLAVETTEQVEARQRVEELAAKAERRAAELDVIVNAIADGLIICNRNAEVVRMNPAAEAILEYPAREREGTVVERASLLRPRREDGAIFPPEEYPVVRALRGQTTHGVTMVLNLLSGRQTWISVSAAPITSAEGGVLGGVVSFTDVTERRRMEEALRASEAKYRSLVEPNVVGIITSDMERIIDANDAFLATVGYTREDLAEGRIRWREMTPPEYTALDERGLEEMLATGRCAPYEKEYLRKDGSRVPILIGASLLERDPPKWVCFVLDVTEQKKAREEREELLRQKDEFLSIAAHELKTPMTSMKGYAQYLLQRVEGLPESTELQRGLRTIDSQVNRMVDLVDRLLDVSRIQMQRLELKREPVDIVELARVAAEEARMATNRHEISVRAAVPELIGQWDRHRLTQVLANLLSNAIRYSPEGGHIEVLVERRDGEVMVSVRDEGLGITKEAQARLFERYYRAPDADRWRAEGFGLGLYIAHGIVTVHGGRIWVESEVGKGSTFYFSLPMG